MVGETPLYVATRLLKSLPLVLWLLDEKGADVNATMSDGSTATHTASSLDTLNALLDHGADPTLQDKDGWTILMWQSFFKRVDVVARLLQEPRVRAIVNFQNNKGRTALHQAFMWVGGIHAGSSIVRLLLQVGADPTIIDKGGLAPLAYLQKYYPTHQATMALLEHALADAEKTSLLVKARRLVITARNAVAPSYLQGHVARGQPLPHVAQASVTGSKGISGRDAASSIPC